MGYTKTKKFHFYKSPRGRQDGFDIHRKFFRGSPHRIKRVYQSKREHYPMMAPRKARK